MASSVRATVKPTAVSGKGVSVAYGNRVAVAPSDFSLQRGTVTALVGPNGSGKTTLLSAVAGLLPIAGGALEVLGHAAGARALVGRVACLLQTTPAARHLPITVREVVTMARFAARGPFGRLTAEDRRIALAAMAELEVADIADEQLRMLSGGQRQRVLVAQAVAQRGELLLLDEPLTGLDLASTRRIWGALVDMAAAGGTVVVATHDLGDAERCDHVLLVAGRVVAEGRPGDVLTPANLRAAYGGRLGPLESDSRLIDGHHEPSWRDEPLDWPGGHAHPHGADWQAHRDRGRGDHDGSRHH